MANTKVAEEGSVYVIVDTAPVVGGFWTAAVQPKRNHNTSIEKLFFSVRENSVAVCTPSLQFKCKDDADWSDYNADDAYVVGDRFKIESGATGEQWRAGVKEGDFTSGEIVIGFDW